MARYDKYEPIAGGFRARLADDWAAADGVIIGVGLDVDGLVVPGAGNSGLLGVVVLVGVNTKQGDVVDVMTSGEILEAAGLAAGTKYFADATTGVISATGADDGDRAIGHTVEADRLVVRLGETTVVP